MARLLVGTPAHLEAVKRLSERIRQNANHLEYQIRDHSLVPNWASIAHTRHSIQTDLTRLELLGIRK